MEPTIEAISNYMLASTLAAYAPGKRLRFYEIVNLDEMIVKPVAMMISKKSDGTVWCEDFEPVEFIWKSKYPESLIKAISLDILLPGNMDAFSVADQEKLVEQEIRAILVKSVFVTRAHLGKKDFYGVLVIESEDEIIWEQNELIEILKASEQIALGILCNDVMDHIHHDNISFIPAFISQSSSYIVVTDAFGTILYAPYGIVDILGYRAHGEMLSRNIAKFVHPDDVAILQNCMGDWCSGGIKVLTRNIRYVTRTRGACLCETQIMSNGKGKLVLKISQPKWFEIDKWKPRQSVVYGIEFVKYFAEQIEGIVWVVSEKLEFTYLSSYVTKLLGWSVDQLMHDPRVTMFDAKTLDVFADALVRGAISYRNNPTHLWTEEIRGNAKTWDGKLMPVKIGIFVNTMGGDYHGFGGVIKPV